MHAPCHFLPKQLLVSISCVVLTLAIGATASIVQTNPVLASPALVSVQTTGSPQLFSFSFAAAAAGILKSNANGIWFGKIAVGTSKVASVTLSNGGTASLTIVALSPNLPAFSLAGLNLPLTLAPAQKIVVQVTFAPQAAGHVDGNFSFTSTASATPFNLSVHGGGIASGVIGATPANLSFVNVLVGGTASLPEILTNTGGAPLTINQVSASGSGFSVSGVSLPLTLAAGQSVSLSVAFNPQTAGQATGNLSVSSTASNPALTIPLAASSAGPGVLSVNSTSINFGSVQMGSSESLPGTLTNSGGSSVTVSQASVTGAGFAVSGLTLPITLAAGQSAGFTLAFNPQSPGTASGSLAFSSNASNSPLAVTLSGSGVSPGMLSLSSASLTFGSLSLGTSSILSETLTNSGGSSVVISQSDISNSDFSTSGLEVPITLVSGQSFTFGVSFAPMSPDSETGTITLQSNASNPNLSVSLSGSGAAAPAHSVSLSWSPSVSAVAGYNVYRGAQSGGPYNKLNPSLAANTTYSDSSIQSGQNYFYVTTAVSSSGMESGYSNEAQTTVPGGAGVAGLLAATSSTLSFGSVQVGNNQALSETLTNSGAASVTISQASVSGAGFSTSGLTLPLTLAPGQSFTFSAAFAPASAGNASGSLSVVSNASDPALAISLAGSGTAAGQLSVTPSTLAFGGVAVGQSKTSTATLSATGSSVTISSAAANTPEFVVTGMSFPLTLAVGQSAAMAVTFTPQASGAASDSLSLLSNASNSPAVASLTGSGSAAVQHSVALTWTDTGSGISGYNIYRSASSGGPFNKINPTPNATTAYSDNSVQAGQTYYYLTTALNAAGTESGYSNQVSAVVPTP